MSMRTATKQTRSPIAEYVYRDEVGRPLYKKVRYAPKTFETWRSAGTDAAGTERWLPRLTPTTPRVLYRLPEILNEQSIALVEGEKDADALWHRGIPATTTVGGATAKWRDEYNEVLEDKDVVIICDNDPAGLLFGQRAAAGLRG